MEKEFKCEKCKTIFIATHYIRVKLCNNCKKDRKNEMTRNRRNTEEGKLIRRLERKKYYSNPEKKEMQRKSDKRRKNSLSDGYIKNLIAKHFNYHISCKDIIDKNIIQFKREQILLLREIRNGNIKHKHKNNEQT